MTTRCGIFFLGGNHELSLSSHVITPFNQSEGSILSNFTHLWRNCEISCKKNFHLKSKAVRTALLKPRSLLDSGSMVTLMTQWYFEECLKSKIPEPQPGGAHNLFNLKGVGENQVPLNRYFTCDITIGGMVVPDVGILVKTNRILTTSKGVKTKVPIIIGCNVFKHATRKFIQDYGEMALELFECPKEIDPLFFSCVELYYFLERDRKTTALSSEEGEANGKRGVGVAHMASSQVGGESAIGPNSAQGKNGRESKSNFPPKKKCKNHSGDLGGLLVK